MQDSLILNVYLDPAGKALVTGYADNISGLEFLARSEYQYENDTRRLYALTDGLTAKSNQLWTLDLGAEGVFEDYRITFYLPGDIRLGSINASDGLQYHLSAFNDSLVADVQGYDVLDPSISIQYQRPLAAGSTPISPSGLPPSLPPGYFGADLSLILLLGGAFMLAMGSALGVILWRRRIGMLNSPTAAEKSDQMEAAGQTMSAAHSLSHALGGHDPSRDEYSGEVSPSPAPAPEDADEGYFSLPDTSSIAGTFADGGGKIIPHADDEALSSEVDKDIEKFRRAGEQPDAELDQVVKKATNQSIGVTGKERIELSREMEAVIQTLTPREQAVITTLVEHGGRMTQAEIRYETRTPKSSLTGILISLERRKLVTKKEWGRTNIIELSEWFLSQKERS